MNRTITPEQRAIARGEAIGTVRDWQGDRIAQLEAALASLLCWAAMRSDWLAAGKAEPPDHPINTARRVLAGASHV